MPTLADLLQGGRANPRDIFSDRSAYDQYAEACMASGRAPLPFSEWVKAGKPSQ